MYKREISSAKSMHVFHGLSVGRDISLFSRLVRPGRDQERLGQILPPLCTLLLGRVVDENKMADLWNHLILPRTEVRGSGYDLRSVELRHIRRERSCVDVLGKVLPLRICHRYKHFEEKQPTDVDKWKHVLAVFVILRDTRILEARREVECCMQVMRKDYER